MLNGITKSNVIILYRQGNPDSLELAEYYADLHNLESFQIVPVPCSGDEILANYTDFYTQIEHPVLTYLGLLEDEYTDEYSDNQIKCIISGYGVPGGYYDEDGLIIATGSRLSRIYFNQDTGVSNPIFNRVNYTPYSESDSIHALVTSRIDAPNLDLAKKIVDSAKIMFRQGGINGTFYFDKINVSTSSEEDDYTAELEAFENSVLSSLNMTTFKTQFWDEYTDVVIPRGEFDSIIWSWHQNTSGYTFFKDSNKARFFLYNADEDGAFSVRDVSNKKWPVLALTSGYSNTAGSMSETSADSFLRPRIFFNSLLNGATVGEAFLFACPKLDWTVCLFGDPLIKVRFPKSGDISSLEPFEIGWERMQNIIDDAIGFSLHREKDAINAYQEIMNSTDPQMKQELFNYFTSFATGVISETKNGFSNLISSMVNLQTSNLTFEDFLNSNDFKINSLWLSIIEKPNLVSSAYLYDVGFWNVDTTIDGSTSEFQHYNYKLEISLFDDFRSIELTSYSNIDNSQWEYEKELGIFYAFPIGGVSSNFNGRRVRFNANSDQYFDRGTVFFARFTQIIV
jgi:uncharacterized protein (TIGR03790 family)